MRKCTGRALLWGGTKRCDMSVFVVYANFVGVCVTLFEFMRNWVMYLAPLFCTLNDVVLVDITVLYN